MIKYYQEMLKMLHERIEALLRVDEEQKNYLFFVKFELYYQQCVLKFLLPHDEVQYCVQKFL